MILGMRIATHDKLMGMSDDRHSGHSWVHWGAGLLLANRYSTVPGLMVPVCVSVNAGLRIGP